MRVLSVMCHPDDMEIDCAGTLLKYKRKGWDVISCHVTNGNMGHMEIMPAELRKIRMKEAQNAAKIAGFECICADINDLTVNSANEEQVKKIVSIIRYAKPDVIITHSPLDYCSDHIETSRLVFNASFSASCPHFEPSLGGVSDVTPIFYAEPDDGLNFIPAEYVDISEEMDVKAEMLKCHKSQFDWLKEHDDSDVLADMYLKVRNRGKQCGVEYAEAFNQLIASGRMRPYRMLP